MGMECLNGLHAGHILIEGVNVRGQSFPLSPKGLHTLSNVCVYNRFQFLNAAGRP